MNINNIQIIANYEVKLLKRSWLFRIFAILSIIGITGVIIWQMTPLLNPFDNHWQKEAISSQIPFYGTICYNIAQTIIMIFLSNSFLKRDKKLDTAEVIYVRPMSNSDYIIGKTWGIIKVFVSLHIIVLAITALIHSLLTDAPFSIFPYFFYLFTISIPSSLFILGLSYIFTCLIKNQAVTFLIMLGLIGIEFFYIKGDFYGVFDFFGANIPAVFSDVTGHPHLYLFLLQRFIFSMAGMGFICLTISAIKRLPHKPWKTKILVSIGSIFLIISISAGTTYILLHRKIADNRKEYVRLFEQYANKKYCNIIRHDLIISTDNNSLKGISNLTLKNKNKNNLSEIILYLNPSLSIKSISQDNQPLDFHREEQVIVINHALAPEDSLSLNIVYQGEIDESICYADILEDDFLNYNDPQHLFPIGKKYAWISDKFTLLTPECIWYPISIPIVNPQSPYNLLKDFTYYTLTVENKNNKTILSQGEKIQQGDKTVFKTHFPLPCISLTIAEYEHKSIQVDSISYELLYFKDHDFFTKWFEPLQDTLPSVIRELKNDIEINKGRNYPYKKLIVVETPAQHATYIRNWKGYTEYVLPGIVFIPERGIRLNIDFETTKYRYESWNKRHSKGTSDKTGVAINILDKFIRNTFLEEDVRYSRNWNEKYVNPFSANALLFHYTGFIHSDIFPIFDIALNTMQCSNENQGSFMWGGIINDEQRANQYLENHSLQNATSDIELKPEIFYELLKLKSKAIKNYITTIISAEEWSNFLKKFQEHNLFSDIPFEKFAEELKSCHNIDLLPFLDKWYNENHSPIIHIQDINANQVIINEETKYQVCFKIYNPSDIDAIITAEIQEGQDSYRRQGRNRKRNLSFSRQSKNSNTKNYILPAESAREIKIITDERPSSIKINTNISHNLPTLHIYNFAKVEEETQDTLSGSFTINPDIFQDDPHEIIIDNEDHGFKTIASNSRHKLKDLLQKEKKEKYKNFTPWRMPSQWTTFAAEYCYGKTIQSAVYKRKGNGHNSINWKVNILQEGFYDISIWNPKSSISGGPLNRSMSKERNQTYTVLYGNEKEDITIDLGMEENDWISLGTFDLPEGITTIILTDKVSGKFVMADAVKFTKID